MDDIKQLTDGTAPATEVVKTRNGGKQVVYREKGMFSRKPSAPSKEQAQEALVSKLTETDAEGSSVLEKILDNQIAAAVTPAAQPLLDRLGNVVRDSEGNPVMVVDSKVMMASAKASQVVLKSAGLEVPEKQPVLQNRVEIVIIQPPDNMMHKEIVEDKPRPPLVPNFAEITEIRTNPAPTAIMDEPKPTPKQAHKPKQQFEVFAIYESNKAAMKKVTDGLTMATIRERSIAQESVKLQVRPDGHILQGHIHVAAAFIAGQQFVYAEVI